MNILWIGFIAFIIVCAVGNLALDDYDLAFWKFMCAAWMLQAHKLEVMIEKLPKGE